jgi:hypothetical protein
LYTSTFTPSTTPLTAISGTQLLTCQSNRLVDNGPNNSVITLGGTPSVQAFGPFGSVREATPLSYSNYFNGTTDYLTAPSTGIAFGTGDFTVECWVYFTSADGVSSYWFGNGSTFVLYRFSDNNLYFYTNSSGTNKITATSINAATYGNRWVHVALTRQSGSTKVFLNGTQVGSTFTSDTTNYTGTTMYIGKDPGGATYFTGYISNFRIITGTALYTSSFTPSTTPLTAIANTQLLTCQSTTMIDNSTNLFTITANGTPKVYKYNPFGYTAQSPASYNPSVHGGSAYFDGTGDYLSNTTTNATKYGTGDFTVEYWVYITVNNSAGFQSHVGSALDSTSFGFGTNGSLNLYWTTSIASGAATTALTLNQWYHVSWVRISGTLKAYLNGVQDYSASVTTNITTAGCGIGAQTSSTYPFGGGYISDIRISNGVGLYKSNFVAPTVTAISTSQTSLLLNFTGGGIVDQHSSNVLETVGNTQLASEDPYSGSYYSNYISSAANYLTYASSAALNVSGNWTIEAWYYFTLLPSGSVNFNLFNFSGGTAYNPYFYLWGDGTIYFRSIQTGGDIVTAFAHGMTVGNWYHIAVTKSSSSFAVYINGVQKATGTSSAIVNENKSLVMGDGVSGQGNAYVSNFRLVTGQVLYTGAFTPGTTPLTTSSVGTTGANVAASLTGTVQLLTCQSNKFIDNSSNALTITRTGTPTVKSFNPFQQNTGKSLYFDGSTRYLYIPSNSIGAFGTGDFTIEFWAYPTVNARQDWIDFDNGVAAARLLFFYDGTNILYYGQSATRITGTPMLLGQWQHVAVCRASGSTKLFINGTQAGSTYADTLIYGAQPLYIGRDGAGSTYVTGYMKDIRITKVARYTSNFTPTTTAFKKTG